MDEKELIGKTLGVMKVDDQSKPGTRPYLKGIMRDRDGVLILDMGREEPPLPIQSGWLEKMEQTPERLSDMPSYTDFLLVVGAPPYINDENDSVGQWVVAQAQARKVKKIKWTLSGAAIGGCLQLLEIIFDNAHLEGLSLAMLFGAWSGSILVTKSRKERLGYLGVWLSSVALVSFYSHWLQHLFPEGPMCCGTSRPGKHRMILESSFLTVCTLIGFHFLWQFVPKLRRRRGG